MNEYTNKKYTQINKKTTKKGQHNIPFRPLARGGILGEHGAVPAKATKIKMTNEGTYGIDKRGVRSGRTFRETQEHDIK